MQQKEKRKRLKILIAAAVFVGIVCFGIKSWKLYQRKTAADANAAAWQEENQNAGDEASEFGVVRNTIEYQGKTYKRNTYVKAILLMGIDRDTELSEEQQAGDGGQSDGIFLIAEDTARDTVKILAIPRDTMTEITLTDLGGNSLGQDIQHLTLAYAYGDGRELSCEYMSQAVTELLGGLEIDGYAAISMKSLGIINDSVGGITVTIDDEGLVSRDPEFQMGATVTLKGDQAEKYIRYRDIEKPQTAISRLERQKGYIEKFSEAMKQTAKEKDGYFTDLLDKMSPYMVTDLTKDQYLEMGMAFLKSSQTLGDEDIQMLPGKGIETETYDEYIPDLEKTQEMVLNLFYRVEE